LVECTTAPPADGPLGVGEIAVQDLAAGEWFRGAAAVRKICFHLPLGLPLGLLLLIPAAARAFNKRRGPSASRPAPERRPA
jgi:hypothetical protein